ncbi:MAG: envelope integrity protein Cei [Rhodococcus sp.]|uniref:envelope integrity protein Cei n=1 Tax=Rhodococcus TaxID=1827 RepID=UPI0016BCB90F|nr:MULTISPECIES: envelope integrity protein Cei [Rhodococcus]NLV80338.1 envelope integrity protein Cei [Rhodococcus sp. (in: high G+C Gram-positive bacteria)]
MVSLITEGSATDERGRPFSRRRAVPAAIVGCVLAVTTVVVWTTVFTGSEPETETVACPAPPTAADEPGEQVPAPAGQVVDRSTLVDIDPAPLAATRVRVYNANGERGQASNVAAELSDYGFASAPDVQAGNDPVYVDQNMQCHGQIRFGESGRAAANTVRLVAPCAELVLDARPDDTIDLALGTYFKDLSVGADAEELLRTLRDAPVGDRSAPLDVDLLDAALAAKC